MTRPGFRLPRVLFGMLCGTFLIWCDAADRGLFGGAELPLSIITAFLGAPHTIFRSGAGRAENGA